jgi:ABC-type sugar transport system permease subunit
MNSVRAAIVRSDLALADAPPSKAAAHPARQMRLVTESRVWAAVLLAPFLALLALFQWAPIGAALYNSFQDFSLTGARDGWAGLQNYRDVVGSGEFQSSLWLTFTFIVVKIVVQVFLGVAAALAAIRNNVFSFVVRSVVFLPTATAIVAVSLMFAFLFDRELGLINAILGALGLPRVAWLFEQRAAQSMMLILSLWRDTGFVMLIFLSGLQSVPSTLVDAARVDGASWWQETRHVTLPLLVRSFQFAAVFATLAAVRFIAPIDIMTQGGPRQATNWPRTIFTSRRSPISPGARRARCRSSCCCC